MFKHLLAILGFLGITASPAMSGDGLKAFEVILVTEENPLEPDVSARTVIETKRLTWSLDWESYPWKRVEARPFDYWMKRLDLRESSPRFGQAVQRATVLGVDFVRVVKATLSCLEQKRKGPEYAETVRCEGRRAAVLNNALAVARRHDRVYLEAAQWRGLEMSLEDMGLGTDDGKYYLADPYSLFGALGVASIECLSSRECLVDQRLPIAITNPPSAEWFQFSR